MNTASSGGLPRLLPVLVPSDPSDDDLNYDSEWIPETTPNLSSADNCASSRRSVEEVTPSLQASKD